MGDCEVDNCQDDLVMICFFGVVDGLYCLGATEVSIGNDDKRSDYKSSSRLTHLISPYKPHFWLRKRNYCLKKLRRIKCPGFWEFLCKICNFKLLALLTLGALSVI